MSDRDAPGRTHYRSERWYGKFERQPVAADPRRRPDKVKATYRDGVLTITLPKAEEIKPEGDQDRRV